MRLPVIFIVFLFIVSFLIDVCISIDFKQMWRKKGMIGYIVFSLLCYADLIVAISLPRKDIDSGITAPMWLLFIFLTIYVGKALYLTCSLFGRLIRLAFKINNNLYPFRLFGGFIGLVVIGVMWIGASYTRHHIQVVNEEFYSKKLPSAFEGYRIVQLSDLHVGTWGNDTVFLKNLVDTVNNLRPDLIVFTGDIVNRESRELIPFTSVLSKLHAKDGVYSILGNHDYGDYVDWSSPSDKERNMLQLKDYQRKMGWSMLNNESVFIHKGNDSILLIGVENWGEPPFPRYGDLDRALGAKGEQKDNNYKLLLSHNPEHWNQEVSKNSNIDLTLSGHTHAMQTMINIGDWKWSPAKYRYEQWGGAFNRFNQHGDKLDINVNTGSGAVGLPARLLSAFPEVTLITLHKEK